MKKAKKKIRKRHYVSITATWGNDDASSTIRITRGQWTKIKNGAEFSENAWSWYEGKRSGVIWGFKNSLFTIWGGEGFEAVIDYPVEELVVEEWYI